MEKIYYNNPLLKRASELRKDENFLKCILDGEHVNFVPMRDDENYFISGKDEIKPLILKRQELELYTKDINLLFEWYQNKKINFLCANEKNFLEFFSYLQRKNYKPSSLNRKLSSLRQFYDVVKAEGYIKINPLNNL